ncbi:MAG: nitroreductase family protein [Actinobacteria bacterium]|nr:nitroreductase family protein [Actinomycetota bacterium]
MEVFEAIEKRRSIRKYRDEPVPEELIDRLLEAARLAPSSSNTQSWKFKVITDPETRRKLKDLALGQKFVEEAPAVIACCIDLNAFGERAKEALKLVTSGAVRPSLGMILRSVRSSKDKDPERVVVNGVINVSIATEHIALAATELGLGTCWIRAFDPRGTEELLGLPEGVSVLCLLTVGYPAQDPPPRPRVPLDDILI